MPRTGVALIVLGLAIPSRNSAADNRMVAVDMPDLAPPYPEECSDDGGIVGRRTCPPYGMWGAARDAPYVLVVLGFNMRHLPRKPRPTTDAIARTTTPTTERPAGADTSYSIAESINIATSPISYIGFEVEISPTTPENPAPGERTFAAGAQLLLGIHGSTRRLKLAAELAAGARVVDNEFPSTDDEPVLEGRARGDLWITPWFTIGGIIGTSFLDRDEWVAGINLGFHTYSYGGL